MITDMMVISGANKNENIRLGRVRLGQCGQIQKILWEDKPKRKHLYILPKLTLHPYNSFVTFKSLSNLKGMSFKEICAKMVTKNWHYSLFIQNVHKI